MAMRSSLEMLADAISTSTNVQLTNAIEIITLRIAGTYCSLLCVIYTQSHRSSPLDGLFWPKRFLLYIQSSRTSQFTHQLARQRTQYPAQQLTHQLT